NLAGSNVSGPTLEDVCQELTACAGDCVGDSVECSFTPLMFRFTEPRWNADPSRAPIASRSFAWIFCFTSSAVAPSIVGMEASQERATKPPSGFGSMRYANFAVSDSLGMMG